MGKYQRGDRVNVIAVGAVTAQDVHDTGHVGGVLGLSRPVLKATETVEPSEPMKKKQDARELEEEVQPDKDTVEAGIHKDLRTSEAYLFNFDICKGVQGDMRRRASNAVISTRAGDA